MTKPLLSIALCLSMGCIKAQTLSPQVLASTGAFSSVGNYSLSYTVGEMAAVETFTGGSIILTQGFQQPNDLVNGLLDIEKEAKGSFVVYPNPAIENLWFGFEFDERGQVDVSLFDMAGRKLDFSYSESYETGKSIHYFDCSGYAAGNYLLSARFVTKSGQVKTITKKFQILN